MEQVLLSANPNNIEECIALAQQHNLGIEAMAFAFPWVLDGDWESMMYDYQAMLEPVPGPLTLHGPFMDMAPGSIDPAINAVCMSRYQHAIRIGSYLGADKIVFHANFIAAIHDRKYRENWHERNVAFWSEIAEYAAAYNLIIALENMWEWDPSIITDILGDVDHPHLRACIDVGHAHLYGPDHAFETWLRSFEPWLTHVHMNNTHGKLDTHNALDDGIIDYEFIIHRMRQLPISLTYVLELYEVSQMKTSLPFFLAESTPQR